MTALVLMSVFGGLVLITLIAAVLSDDHPRLRVDYYPPPSIDYTMPF